MKISPKQLYHLAEVHSERVVDSLDEEHLREYAYHAMVQSFDTNPGVGDTNLEALVRDMIDYEGGNSDPVFRFLVKQGVQNTMAKAMIDVD